MPNPKYKSAHDVMAALNDPVRYRQYQARRKASLPVFGWKRAHEMGCEEVGISPYMDQYPEGAAKSESLALSRAIMGPPPSVPALPAAPPVKKKMGRPRKYPLPEPPGQVSAQIVQVQPNSPHSQPTAAQPPAPSTEPKVGVRANRAFEQWEVGKDAFHGRVCAPHVAIKWAMENILAKDVTPDDCPGPMAWTQLAIARMDPLGYQSTFSKIVANVTKIEYDLPKDAGQNLDMVQGLLKKINENPESAIPEMIRSQEREKPADAVLD